MWHISYTEFRPNGKVNVENTDKNYFTSLAKVRPLSSRFSWRSLSPSGLPFRGHLLYRNLLTWEKKYSKYEQNFIHYLRQSISFTAPIFTKLTLLNGITYRYSVTNFTEVGKKKYGKDGQKFIYALTRSITVTDLFSRNTCSTNFEKNLHRISRKS
jgi:hypothetical protein